VHAYRDQIGDTCSPSATRVRGVGDFDGDRRDDLTGRDPATEERRV